MRTWERINLTRVINKQARIREESSFINSINHQTSNMNKGERKEKKVLKSASKKTLKL
jgi:hypothetical protein